MFRGNHPTRVDDKGRLKVPAEFKHQIEEKYGHEVLHHQRRRKNGEGLPD